MARQATAQRPATNLWGTTQPETEAAVRLAQATRPQDVSRNEALSALFQGVQYSDAPGEWQTADMPREQEIPISGPSGTVFDTGAHTAADARTGVASQFARQGELSLDSFKPATPARPPLSDVASALTRPPQDSYTQVPDTTPATATPGENPFVSALRRARGGDPQEAQLDSSTQPGATPNSSESNPLSGFPGMENGGGDKQQNIPPQLSAEAMAAKLQQNKYEQLVAADTKASRQQLEAVRAQIHVTTQQTAQAAQELNREHDLSKAAFSQQATADQNPGSGRLFFLSALLADILSTVKRQQSLARFARESQASKQRKQKGPRLDGNLNGVTTSYMETAVVQGNSHQEKSAHMGA